MTGEETAISTVRMLPEESRAIFSNILTADKFKDFIENIKHLDETYEKTEENNLWVELEKQIGKKDYRLRLSGPANLNPNMTDQIQAKKY